MDGGAFCATACAHFGSSAESQAMRKYASTAVSLRFVLFYSVQSRTTANIWSLIVSDVLRNNTVLTRFEQKLDGGVAFATYRASSGKLTIVHTEVPTEMRGSGVGSRFVRSYSKRFEGRG